MRNVLAIGCLAAACISGTAQAALFVNQYGIGTNYSTNVSIKTALLPANSSDNRTAWVGEQNFGSAAIVGQSFTATETRNVGYIEMSHASSGTINLLLEMYDMGVGPFDEPWNVADAVGGNLLATRANTATIGGAAQQVVQFYFTGADEIPVLAGRRYMVRVRKTGGDGALTLYRNTNGDFYTGGDGYRFNTNGSDPDGVIIRGGAATRDLSLGIGYAAIPEPSSLGLAAVGSLAMLRRRRV
jgi:hypothetical protein